MNTINGLLEMAYKIGADRHPDAPSSAHEKFALKVVEANIALGGEHSNILDELISSIDFQCYNAA